MIVVSRYTESGKYPAFAARLLESCKRFGLRHSIKPMTDHGDWHTNDIYKPSWLLSVLITCRTSVCWMDADCEIKQYPTLLIDPACDFACYNWNADPENNNNMEYNPQVLQPSGGVIFFRYTAPSMELLLRWNEECEGENTDEGSDPPLARAFNQGQPPVRTLWLPKSYNRMDSLFPDVDPVIDHTFRNRAHEQRDIAAST